jgi:hypothetical protein
MKSRGKHTPLDEYRPDHGQVGSDSAGQSGDTEGLSPVVDESDESVEELVETGQAFEAEAVQGVQDADDNPERPVQTHEGPGRPSGAAPGRSSK